MPRRARALKDKALRVALTAAHQLLKLKWLVRRPRTYGAHALALTPERNVMLVKLRYAPGWRLPGGGRSKTEEPDAAVLRELREEIGMISHGRVRLAREVAQHVDFKRDLASLFVVDNVEYRPPRWSWEVESVRETALDQLPADLAPLARTWVEALRGHV
jgi:8-oxo-dGTP pyrophosphatase MutT (NUDIX family)